MKTRITIVGVVLVGAALIGGLGVSLAQQAGIKRTLLLKQDLSVEGREVVMATAEIPAGGAAGKHYHHGEEVGYVLEGNGVLEIEGQPPLALKPGQSYSIPAGKVHDAKAVGEGSTKVLTVYIVERSGSANLNGELSGNSGHYAGLEKVWREGVFDGQEEIAGCKEAAAQAHGRL